MTGYYELKSAGSNGFMFNLKAGNHETILSSQTYTTKDAAKGGIESVQTNSLKQDRYERKVAKDGAAYFVLNAANNQIIGTSEMYSSTSARDKGIESVTTNGPAKTIKEIDN